MNAPEIALIAMVVVPILLVMILRANATLVFLSLCLGAVVTQFLSRDIEDFANMFFPQANLASYELRIGLLLAPALLTALLMLRSLKGAKYVLNILPALAVGCVIPLLVVPLLPPDARHAVSSVPIWQSAIRAQDLIVGIGALTSLLFLWVQRTKTSKASGDKKSA